MDSKSSEDISVDPDTRFRALVNLTTFSAFDKSIAAMKYYRSGKEMLRMANVYEIEKKHRQAFLLYMRYATLFAEKVPKLPDRATFSSEQQAEIRKNLKIAMKRAEELKEIVKQELRAEFASYQRRLESAAVRQQNADIPAAKETIPPARRDLVEPRPSAPPPPYGLRRIHIPVDLRSRFSEITRQNTLNNVETCGFLLGRLSHDEFRISHLFLPEQYGTADSCRTESEFDLIEYQDKHSLISLGWIHTHPSQTAFLSSVDLHMHFAYQVMLADAIAIVYSPKFNDCRTFTLTERGMQVIGTCRQDGHHHHPEYPPLFEEARHTIVDETCTVTVADLRR